MSTTPSNLSPDAPDTIDALLVARRIVEATEPVAVTAEEVFAMAGCLVGLDQLLDAADARPTVNARLAAAVAALIEAREAWDNLTLLAARGDVPGLALARLPAADAAFVAAFNTLKTIFETEFPHV